MSRLLLVILLAAGSAAMLAATPPAPRSPARQDARFSARKEIVRLDTLVTEGGVPVTGLTKADFEIRDNGVLQALDFVSFDELPINVVLMLDVSGSVDGTRLQRLQAASRALLSSLRTGDEAALMTFSQTVALPVPLTRETRTIGINLESAKGHGQTALIDAIQAGLVLGEADAARSLVVVFSDGIDSASWLTPEEVISTSQHVGSIVYAISESGYSKPPLLADLTKATGGSLFDIAPDSDLNALFVGALTEFRQRYVIGYSPSGVAAAGWHTVEIKLKGSAHKAAKIKARSGYAGGS